MLAQRFKRRKMKGSQVKSQRKEKSKNVKSVKTSLNVSKSKLRLSQRNRMSTPSISVPNIMTKSKSYIRCALMSNS